MTPSNEELLARYQRADMAAFELFYNRHQKLIFHVLLARLGNRADAEEAFQETFLRVHRAVLGFDARQSAVVWVLTIARNVAVDALRKRQRIRASAQTLAATSPTDYRPTAEASIVADEALRHLTSELSAEERALIESRILVGESFDEIAAKRGITPASARQKLSRLLRKVRSSD